MAGTRHRGMSGVGAAQSGYEGGLPSRLIDLEWQNFAERIRELLFIAKQSMTAEQYVRFKALVKMTVGTGYTTRLRRLLGQTPKNFLNFDESSL